MSANDELRNVATSEGAVLFGVADLAKLDSPHGLIEEKVLSSFPFAIVAAARLSRAILDEIEDHPSKAYFHHYRMLNKRLRQLK